jgi:hypothetical protein
LSLAQSIFSFVLLIQQKKTINNPDSLFIIPSFPAPSLANAKEQGGTVESTILKKRLSFAVYTFIIRRQRQVLRPPHTTLCRNPPGNI